MDQKEQVARRRRGRWASLGIAALVVAAVAAMLYALRGPIRASLARGPEYHARFASVGGLRPGDEVRYGGLAVGRVRSTRIDPADPTQILVTFRVSDDTPIRANTTASVIDVTNPVSRYLSLRTDSPPGGALPSGRTLRTEAGPTLEETLIGVTRLLERTDTLLTAAAPVLRRDFFMRLDRTTARLDRTMAVLARSAERMEPTLQRATAHLDEIMAHTERVLATVDSASPELRAASSEALLALQDTRSLVGDLRTGALQGGGLAELMRNLTTTSDNLARLTARLERSPASVLRGRRAAEKRAGPPVRD